MMKGNKVPRILIVDDEKDFQILIQQRFRKQIQAQHFEFVFAYDGIEALDILKSGQWIDVLITDIHMPGMDGLGLLSKMPLYSPHTRSIVLSAYDDIQNLRKAMNYGAYDFLTKPVNFMDLENILERTTFHARPFDAAFLDSNTHLDLFEKDLATQEPAVLSFLQVEEIFFQAGQAMIRDSFVVHQGCVLLLLIAENNSLVSKFSLLKIREVMRALALKEPRAPETWIHNSHAYQTAFVPGYFGLMGGWIDLENNHLTTACFPEHAFFFQGPNHELMQTLQGSFAFFPGETKIFYKTQGRHEICPLISFKKSLKNCLK